MPSLRELQQRFANAIVAGDTATRLTQADFARHGERIDIYRHTIASNYRNALGATYPVVARLVGAPFFHAAVDAYVDAHPSRSGDLNEYGDAFGDFLAGYPPAAGLPYLPDVARLEWAIDEANRAHDSILAPDIVLGAFATLAAERLPGLRIDIEPSCRLLASPFPVLRIWQVNQPGHQGDLHVDFRAGPDRLRVRREPGGVSIERVAEGDYAWLSALAQRATLAEAIERAQEASAAFDLQAALHAFIGDGTIAGIGDHTIAGASERRAAAIGEHS